MVFLISGAGEFPGGAVTKTVLLVQRAYVQSLIKVLDPTCCN